MQLAASVENVIALRDHPVARGLVAKFLPQQLERDVIPLQLVVRPLAAEFGVRLARRLLDGEHKVVDLAVGHACDVLPREPDAIDSLTHEP